MFAGRDATEVIHAFHSDSAHTMLARLPKYTPPAEVVAAVPDVTDAQRAFRKLRSELIQQGWFQRNFWLEAAHLAAWAACVALGVAAANSSLAVARALAFVPLGLSFTAAGWLAHDYIHGRGAFCTAMRHFGGWGAGFGATMWSDKHNRHHALTNEVGQDEDLSGGPVLFLWAPDPVRDKAWRHLQGVYYLAAFSLLHWVWRIDSLVVSIKRGPLWPELLPILAHYAIYLSLVPASTFIAAVFLGGFVMANIVTTSHQSEELLFTPEHDWVRMQFRTTRDAEPGNWFTSWLWGGMQHQLEHHLFPTMPRYKYPALIPIMKAFAAEHGLPYKSESDWAIWQRTWKNYQRVAAEAAVPGAPGPRKGVTI
jgi:fatty acid desaturase